MRNAGPVSVVLTAGGWIGLVVFLLWQELGAERGYRYPTPWWFRVPVTLLLGLVVLVFAIESLMQEMTVRRWATSVLVFAVMGVLLILVGIFDPEALRLPRGVLLPFGAFYLVAAGAAGAAAKDGF